MSPARVALRQVAAEQRVFWRNRAAAFFTFLLPIMFLALLGALGNDSTIDGVSYAQYTVPGMVGMGIVVTAFAGLAITLTIRRDTGVLKRLRGTPLPPATYLGALIASMTLVLAAETVVILLLGRGAFDVPLPADWLEFIGVAALGAACFSAMGVAVSRFVPNAEGSSAVVNAIYLPLLFLSGAFFPVDELPLALRAIAELSPLTHLLEALRGLFAGGGLDAGQAAGLLVVLAWGAGAALLAARTFSWEPRGA